MNNILYQKSLQLFQSENNDEQKKLYDEILELTNKALKSADQNFLSEALDEAEKKLQVLCANCNKIKAVKEEEHAKSKRTKFIYKKL